MTDCLAPHVPVPQSGYVRLTWLDPRGDVRCRVVAWTCDCKALIYELCELGGLGFIRRTVQGDTITVTETHRMPIWQVRQLWAAVLVGMAR
ncbi:hypothetical protein GCM10023194_78240 [Planotetraspora phitsanulokensis]|uniref:Uncharacterized protein n=1 Tax=Planotetraspora phitsanulokensis TaxID=575192 RepID=A0A8J3UA66_9ACTN|nr:hypothetical protein [Planotetraspora phitsanulokensis]GII41110.1 hypothetical protein Pph01_61130 [Planotetraspora phitsanulokensis]